MWLQFFSQDTHFTIHLFAALVCLAVSWLYFDSWTNKKERNVLMRWLGFGILSISFLAQATVMEQSVLGKLTISHYATGLVVVLRVLGFISIILSMLLDPVQKIPELKGLEFEADEVNGENQVSAEVNAPVSEKDENEVKKSKHSKSHKSSKASSLLAIPTITAKLLVPVGGIVTAVLYWRRATVGLERHLKAVAIAFLLIGISDFLNLATIFRTTSNPIVYTWVAAFGPIWWVEQTLLLLGVLFLGKWVWSYLTERFFSQLFMILVSSTVIIFLVVSITFTALLLRSVRADMVNNLKTAAQVVNYAVAAKQSETSSGAEMLAGNQDIASALLLKDHNRLVSLTNNYLADKKQTSLIFTDQNGQVLLRGEDPSRWGDSISSDSLVRRSLLGEESSSVIVSQGAITPIVEERSSVPVYSDGQLVGSVTTGTELGQAFVDGLNSKTGLQSAIYGGNIVSATSLLGSDNTTHITGTILNDKNIKSQVLVNGLSYSGDISVAHRDYLGSIESLKDSDNVPVGMLLIAEPQDNILRTAGQSVELTFVMTALLILLSVVPAYFVTKSLVKQLDH